MSKKSMVCAALIAAILFVLVVDVCSAAPPRRFRFRANSASAKTYVKVEKAATTCPCGETCKCCDACAAGKDCTCKDCKCCANCPGNATKSCAKAAKGCPCGETCKCCDACAVGKDCTCKDCKCCVNCPGNATGNLEKNRVCPGGKCSKK